MGELFLKSIRLGDYPTVEKIISKKESVLSYCDKHGDDALFYSVVHPHIEIFNLISSRELSFSRQYDKGKSILHIAIESDLEDRGFFDIILTLINKCENVNLSDIYGNTALWYACTYYVINKNTINALLNKGADINIQNRFGSSVLSSAQENNRIDLLKILGKGN